MELKYVVVYVSVNCLHSNLDFVSKDSKKKREKSIAINNSGLKIMKFNVMEAEKHLTSYLITYMFFNFHTLN